MKPLSLYVDRPSPIHRLDPVTKLIYAVCLATVPFVVADLRWAGAAIVLNLAVLGVARSLRRGLAALGAVAFFVATILVVQGIAYRGNATPVGGLGPLTLYEEGLLVGLALTARFVNLTMAAFVLLFTAKPEELVAQLVRAGLPARAGYVLQSVLQIVPSMVASVAAIQDAQRSRGVETEGSLATRVRAFLPILGPLVTSSLVSMQERAMALEARAFGATGRRTWYRPPPAPGAVAHAVRAVSMAALAAAAAWRVLGR